MNIFNKIKYSEKKWKGQKYSKLIVCPLIKYKLTLWLVIATFSIQNLMLLTVLSNDTSTW